MAAPLSRSRPSAPTAAAAAAATEDVEAAARAAVADLTRAVQHTLAAVRRVRRPVARARVADELLHAILDVYVPAAKEVRRDAVVAAYERGKRGNGRYGYGTLAVELGLTKARIQQIIGDIHRGRRRASAD